MHRYLIPKYIWNKLIYNYDILIVICVGHLASKFPMFFLGRDMLQISISSPKNYVCGIKNILTCWLYHLLEVFEDYSIDYMYKSRIKLTSEKREQYKRNFDRGKFAR